MQPSYPVVMTVNQHHTFPQLAARVQQAAKMIGVSSTTLYSWNARGLGPKSFRAIPGSNRNIMYRIKDLEEWVKQRDDKIYEQRKVQREHKVAIAETKKFSMATRKRKIIEQKKIANAVRDAINAKKVVRAHKAASMLGISLMTLNSWIKQGIGPKRYMPTSSARPKICYRVNEIEEWIDSQNKILVDSEVAVFSDMEGK